MKLASKKGVLMGKKTSLSLLAGALMGGSISAQEQDFAWESEFAQKLMTYETQDLTDIAVMQLEKMLKKYPEQKDTVNLLIAEVYHLQNQNKSFEEIIVKISKSSPIYGKALQLKGQRAVKRGKADEAIKIYAEYFQLFPQPPEAKEDKESWKYTVNMYSNVLSSAGQTSKAQEVKEWLVQAADSKFEIRKIAFESSRIELQSIEASTAAEDATLKFNGKNSTFKIPNVKFPAKYTVEMMVKPATNNAAAFFVARPAGNAKEYHAAMLLLGKGGTNKNATLEVHHSANSKKVDHKIGSGAANDGKFHHVAMTFDGKALRLYRDGKEIAVKPDKIASIGDKKLDLYIGCDGQKSFFNGEIDNVRVWNRALTPKQIADNKFDSLNSGSGLVLSYDFDDKKGVNSLVGNAKAEPKGTQWGAKNARELKLNAIVTLLKDNTYQNDYISAASQVEMARCYWLLREYKAAVTVLRQGAELMLNLEKSMVKGKQDINLSPLAGAFFYYGMCYKDIAVETEKAGNKAKAEKAYKGALDKFAELIKKYPESSYAPRCRIALSEVKEAVVAMGWGDDQLEPYKQAFAANLSAGTAEGNAFYFSGDYDKAIASYRKALIASLRGAKIKEALKFLTMSLIKNPNRVISDDGRCWEAEAVASYLISAYPTADEAVDVCLRMGGMYGAAQGKATGELKEKLTDSTLRWFGEYINMRPRDERAADLKFKIAENSRAKTVALVKDIQAAEGEPVKFAELTDQLNRELYKLIPQYVDLSTNYSASPQGIKSSYILARIYSQLERYVDAAEAYKKYGETETDPKVDLLTISLAAGLEYMKAHEAAKAVAQFQATIDMAKESGKKDKATKDLIEKSYSLMATANDIIGDKAYKQIADIGKEIFDINAASRDAGRTIRANEKAIEKLAESLKEVNKDFTEITESLGLKASTDAKSAVGENATAEEKAVAERQKAQKSKKLRSILLKQIKDASETDKAELEKLADAANAELECASDAINENSVVKSRAKLAISDAEKLIKVSDLRLANLVKDKEKAVKKRAAVREELDKVLKELATVREAMSSPDRKEREAAEIRQFELLDQLRPARLEDKKAVETLQDIALSEQVDKAKYESDKAGAEKTIAEQSAAMKSAERDLKRLELRKTVYTAKTEAYKAGLARNKVQATLLKKKDFKKYDKDITKANKTYNDLLTEANKKENELFALDKTFLEEDNATLTKQIEDSKVKVAELEKSKAPHQQVFKKYKTEAVKYYDQFLALYKKSNEFGAKNLAKAGKIYIDFENFEKAATYLNRLKKDFPTSPEIKKSMFDLANAYVKIGKYDQAVTTYNEVLKNTKEHSAAKLSTLQRTLLDVYEKEGDNAKTLLPVSAKAGKALYAKIKAKKSDKSLASQHDVCLFRIGEAYFFAKDYDNALKYYDLLLSANDKTGFLFKVLYHQGVAFKNKKNPDLDAATDAFNEVTRFGDKAGPVMTYSAMVESAATSAAKNNYAGTKNAIGTLELVVSGFSPENPELQPIFERAYNLLVKYLAFNGRTDQAKKYADEYIKNFPKGKYRAIIKRLPAKKYSAPAKPKVENN